jgi:hypothetical protein
MSHVACCLVESRTAHGTTTAHSIPNPPLLAGMSKANLQKNPGDEKRRSKAGELVYEVGDRVGESGGRELRGRWWGVDTERVGNLVGCSGELVLVVQRWLS